MFPGYDSLSVLVLSNKTEQKMDFIFAYIDAIKNKSAVRDENTPFTALL